MAKLSKDAKERIIISLTSEPVGKEVIRAIEEGDDVLSGNGAPDNSLGENGNLYVNLINGTLYVKANNTWGLLDSGGPSPVTSVNGEIGDVILDKTDIGLGQVDNTSDLDKPISNATQDALDLKANLAHVHPLSDLTQSGASVGQVPVWDGSAWVPQSASGASAFEDIEQPVGLKDPSQVSLSIDDSSRTLTVAPVGASFVCFVKGKRIEISSPLQAQWSTAHGLHFFYININGNLITTTTFTDAIITEHTFVSMVYWDATANKHIIFANEKHGIKMSPITHQYLHRTRGAAFDSGGKLVNFVVDGGGGSNTHAQFTSNSGVMWDEDIRIAYPAQAQIPIFYRAGATGLWKRKTANSFPVIISGEEGYTGAGGRLPYNHFNGTNWVLSEVSNNKFVLVHIFATNDIEFPIIGIQGQIEYNSKADARNGAVSEIRELSGLPVYEFCPLGSVIFETGNSYTNTPKARIVSTTDGDDYEDHRLDSIRPGSLA